ncbi:unnamed protein product, partial [Closterium sp. NIES-64]
VACSPMQETSGNKSISSFSSDLWGSDLLSEAQQRLRSCGYSPLDLGKDIAYCGVTGQEMEGRVFVGPTHYLRLKHLAADKRATRAIGTKQSGWNDGNVFVGPSHYLRLKHLAADKRATRASGTKQMNTRQPTKGRAQQGGMRVGEMERDCMMTTRQPTKGRAQQGGMQVGEMERDCLVAHGAAHSLSECLSLLSDDTAVAVRCFGCFFSLLTPFSLLFHRIQPHTIPSNPLQMTTRQPTKGRAQQGGIRVGEMERDCLVAHGAAHSLSERLSLLSDDTAVAVCCFGCFFSLLTPFSLLFHRIQPHTIPSNPLQMTTRQPTKGRAQQGGMRVGEMERDCMVAHGAAHSLSERLSLLSDATAVTVCSACRLIATAAGGSGGGAPGGGGGGGSGFDGYAAAGGFGGFGGEGSDRHGPGCQSCGSSRNTTEVCMPYAVKLLFDEMRAMGISVRVQPSHC